MPDQHPDDNTRGTAVEVWRIGFFPERPDEVDDCGNISESATYAHAHVAKEAEFDGYTVEPGVWRPQAEDALLLGVVVAARGVRGALECTNALRDSLAALDAWRTS